MHKYPPKENDFVFVDPPYDTDFSTYAKNQFDQFDQERLANYLIHECEGNFMLVIKNTELIASLYPIGEKTINGEERSEEHTSELQSRGHLVCRLLLEKKKIRQLSIIS